MEKTILNIGHPYERTIRIRINGCGREKVIFRIYEPNEETLTSEKKHYGQRGERLIDLC